MSSLPPVTTTPNGSLSSAIQAALQSQFVTSDLGKLPSYKLGTLDAAYVPNGTVGSATVGYHNLLLTDAASNLTITPGARPAFPTSTDDPNYPLGLDSRATVVVGGGSTVTFKNDTSSPAFGYDIVSGTGTNKITLNNGPDTFQSTSGNDLVKSGGGFDTIIGGTGHDTIFAGGHSFVTAGSEVGSPGDKIYASTVSGGMDTIQAGTGADTIQLYDGTNTVIGSSGNTTVHAGSGTALFDGSAATGNESITGGTGSLTTNLSSSGNDTIFGLSGHDVAVNLDESTTGASSSFDKTSGVTTIHFSGGQTVEVKNVTISFNDGTKTHY